jgi:monoamine oxidase
LTRPNEKEGEMPFSTPTRLLPIHYTRGRPGVSRRGLLATAAAGAIITAFNPLSASEPSDEVPAQVDVIVVGAGFAGLSAALQIAKTGRSVVVLEARDRVGGRVVNRTIGDGEIVEAGGQWIGPTQNRMARLAHAFGVETYATYDQGSKVTIFGGVRTLGGFSPEIGAEYESLVGTFQTLAGGVPVDAPWTATQALALDSMTLETWINTNTETPEVRAAFGNIADLWGAEPRDLSLLFTLFYIAAAGNERNPGTLARLLGIRKGAQQLRFVGGSQILAQKMASRLGDRVKLSAPVREISLTGSGVLATTDQFVIEAQRIIVALPPPLALGIRYDPELPARRRLLLQNMPMGAILKIQAIYDRPFWREAGLSGISQLEDGPIRETFDNSPPSGSPGVLMGFVGGDQGRGWVNQPADKRRETALASFAAAVGDGALNPIDYFEKDWPRDPWSLGGPVAYMSPGVMLNYGDTIREPVGPIHWAGTETATFWNGYMEGAVRSGERAAREVLDAMA